MSDLNANTFVCVEDGPLVSVILPVYNIPDSMLNRCVESILSQTYRNLEILLVDDGSTLHECLCVLEQLEAANAAVKVVHQQNGGVSLARNAGLDTAQGEYVMFVDPDDELSSNAVLEEAMRATLKNDADIVYGVVEYCFKNQSFPHYFEESIVKRGESIVATFAQASAVSDYFFSYRLPAGSNLPSLLARGPVAKLFKRNVIGSIRFDSSLTVAEDGLFNSQVSARADRITLCNSVWYRYYQYTHSAVHNSAANVESVRTVCEKVRQYYPRYSEQAYLGFCSNLIDWLCVETLRSFTLKSCLTVKGYLNHPWVKKTLTDFDLEQFELSGSAASLVRFQAKSHWVLYCLAIGAGLLSMRFKGKDLIER